MPRSATKRRMLKGRGPLVESVSSRPDPRIQDSRNSLAPLAAGISRSPIRDAGIGINRC